MLFVSSDFAIDIWVPNGFLENVMGVHATPTEVRARDSPILIVSHEGNLQRQARVDGGIKE